MNGKIKLSASAPAFVPSSQLQISLTSGAAHVKNEPKASNVSQQNVTSNALLNAVRAAKATALGCSIIRQLDLAGKFHFQDPEWVNTTIDKVLS